MLISAAGACVCVCARPSVITARGAEVSGPFVGEDEVFVAVSQVEEEEEEVGAWSCSPIHQREERVSPERCRAVRAPPTLALGKTGLCVNGPQAETSDTGVQL